MNFFKIVNMLFVKSARTKKFDNEIDLIFVNKDFVIRIYTGIFNNLYTDYSAKFMRVSSNPNDVFYLASNDNLTEIQESYSNIQVDEGTITTFEEKIFFLNLLITTKLKRSCLHILTLLNKG